MKLDSGIRQANQIVAGGRARLEASPEYRARVKQQLEQLREAIVARHAEQLTSAGWLKRRILYRRIAAELRAERRRLLPSPYAMF